jgi:hypothetical protein
MTQVIDQQSGQTTTPTDLIAEVRQVLAASPEPLTLSKIRAQLPAAHRNISLEDLAESLRRQVAANVVIPYPKYRSQQERYWDRPMRVHIAHLLRSTLAESPLAWSELRRRLPAYVLGQAEPLVQEVLQELLAQGQLHRHPRLGSRGKERFGVAPPQARDYLRDELAALFRRLEQLGFNQAQLRAGALELLHEEEWASPSPNRGAGPQPTDTDRGVGSQPPSPETPPAATSESQQP